MINQGVKSQAISASKKIFYCSSVKKCRLSSYLGNQISVFLASNGFILVDSPEEADALIINTCGFDHPRTKDAVFLISEYVKKYISAKQIIVCGCLPAINPGLGQHSGNLKKIISIKPSEIGRLNELFKPKIPFEKIRSGEIERKLLYRFREKDYAILISQGCVNNCAYCAIKKAKGNVKSRPLADIIKDFKKGLRSGYKMFTLLSDECGSYGVDIGTNFSRLLNEIGRIKGDYAINIYYFEPRRLKLLFKKINPRIFKRVRTICIPIQSTSQRIVNLMNRNYKLRGIYSIIRKIKKINSKISLRTHIIYAYPTETIKEFKNNLYDKNLNLFDEIMLYCYSKNKGTAAAGIKELKRSEKERRKKAVKKEAKNNRSFILPDAK